MTIAIANLGVLERDGGLKTFPFLAIHAFSKRGGSVAFILGTTSHEFLFLSEGPRKLGNPFVGQDTVDVRTYDK